jgi:hypothetical protein
MSDEPGPPPAVDLCECERQVKVLEDCTLPLSAEWRRHAAALKERLRSAAWPTAQESERARVLVLRLMLLGLKGK